MDRDANYFWVGTVVAVALLLFAGFVVWIAGSYDTRNYQRYTVHFTDPVSGLNSGSAVLYKGVPVGRVAAIYLSKKRSDLIRVIIEVKEETPVNSTTQVSLGIAGITGLVRIELTTDTKTAEPVPTMAGEKYPVLIGSGTQIAKLFNDIPQLTRNLLDMSEKMNRLMNPDNVARLEATLANVERMTKDLNGLLSDENIASATSTLRNVDLASADARGMMARLEQSATLIEEVARNLGEAIARNEASLNKFTGVGLEQLLRLSKESEDTAKAVRRLADKLDQDPSQILYRPASKGVTIKP